MAKFHCHLANLSNRITTKIFDTFRIMTLKQKIFSQSDPVLIRQSSKKLQSDPVLIRPKLASVLIQSWSALISDSYQRCSWRKWTSILVLITEKISVRTFIFLGRSAHGARMYLLHSTLTDPCSSKILNPASSEISHLRNFWLHAMCACQRWSDSVFLLSDPILFLKNYIRIRSESCFGWNHTIHELNTTELNTTGWNSCTTSLECMSCLVEHYICNSSVPCMDDGCYGFRAAASCLH